MKPAALKTCLLAALLPATVNAQAAADFGGNWKLDLRSAAEKARKAECGEAAFELQQAGDRITGSHTMATVGCARMNEGGEGTVEGSVSGNRAVLTVTSGRNGAVVKGIATLKNNTLYWQTTEEVKAGETDDSPLILGKGMLKR